MTDQNEKTLSWYAVNTHPHKEKLAKKNLENQDFIAFLPMLQKTNRQARKFQTLYRPLFPSYLFVKMNTAHSRWRAINSTIGVKKLVMIGDTPAIAPFEVVENLFLLSNTTQEINFNQDLKLGSSVKLSDGPFTDFVANLESIDEQGRVLLLLDLMGRKVNVWSDTTRLTPI